MTESGAFTVKFWGVRGSLACPGPETVRYGGNTPCVEMRCGKDILVFDAGTGIRPLGNEIKNGVPLDVDLFFSHTHLDHLVGLPFFAPLLNPDNNVRLWAGHLKPEYGLIDVIRTVMKAPIFPVPPEALPARPCYNDFMCGDTLRPKPGITIRTAPLNHPDRATGYRVEFGGKSICYVTDTEHTNGSLDQNILGLIADADVFIYDSTYTDEEYPKYAGWGHSTWQEGVRLADAAGVGTFVVFHHDPSHDDAFMDGVAAKLEEMRPGSVVAREGLVLQP